MAKKPVRIGGIDFSTKGDAHRFLQEMLNRYHPGEQVNAIDEAFLRDAITRHPEAAEKVGVGVAGFKVRSADYGTQCFWVMRTDGSTDRFSYKACI